MRTVERNQTPIWYANYTGKTPVLDSYGLETGDYQLSYDTPKKLWVSLSESIGLNNLSAQGVADPHPYGITTNYTHRLVTEDLDCPIKEDSIIWHENDPGDNPYDVPHEFKVIRAGKSINFKTYYLRQVFVDG